jgi:hypothetical protein
MIIFGWGSDCKVIGEVGLHQCPRCNNTRQWILVESCRKVHLYFLLKVRWDKKWFCVCPVCNAGIEFDSREKAQDLLLAAIRQQERMRIEESCLETEPA